MSGETTLKCLLIKRKGRENLVHTLKDKQSRRMVTISVVVYSAKDMIGS